MKQKLFLRGLIVVAFAIFSIPFASKAVTTETIGILPAYPDANVRFSDAWFIYNNFDLGQTKTDAVRVINNKKETVVIRLMALDAISTPDGSFALAPDDTAQQGIGKWTKLALTEVELSPESEKLVPFTVSIPKDADVGDHMGGIAMQELDSGEPIQGNGFKIITRVGVRMYVTVPGEIRRESNMTRFDYRVESNSTKSFWKDLLDINKKTYFFVGIKNSGNIKISPRVTLGLKNIFGQTVFSVRDKDLGGVFPRSENNENAIVWDKMPIFGRYAATVTVSFPDQGMPDQTREIVIWAFPYRIIFLLVILGVLLAISRLVKKYFLEASKEGMPIYKVRPGDTLMKISENFAVSWKKIAVSNEIKKPFEVRVDEKLFIPVNRKNKDIIEVMIQNGSLGISLKDRAGHKKSKKKIVIILVLVIVGALAIWGIRWRNNRMIHQEIKTPEQQAPPEEVKETPDKTKSGTFKKSNLSVVVSSSTGEAESNSRLFKKLRLAGYTVSQAGLQVSFLKTTIEYKSGKEEQAKALQKELGISEEVDLKEYNGLGSDLAVFNLAPKDEYLDFDLNKVMVIKEEKQGE